MAAWTFLRVKEKAHLCTAQGGSGLWHQKAGFASSSRPATKHFGKIREGSRFQLNVNKNPMCQVTADFLSIKTDRDLSITLTKCCQCWNTTIKKLNSAVVTTSGWCAAKKIYIYIFCRSKFLWLGMLINNISFFLLQMSCKCIKCKF